MKGMKKSKTVLCKEELVSSEKPDKECEVLNTLPLGKMGGKLSDWCVERPRDQGWLSKQWLSCGVSISANAGILKPTGLGSTKEIPGSWWRWCVRMGVLPNLHTCPYSALPSLPWTESVHVA